MRAIRRGAFASTVLLLAGLALTLGACGKSDSDSSSPPSEAKPSGQVQAKDTSKSGDSKTLRFGTASGYYPFTFQNDAGKLDGYDIQVAEAVAEKLGYKVEWTTAEFSGLFGLLDSGKIDAIANEVRMTDERRKKYLFSRPYVYSGTIIVTKKGNDAVKDLASLKGRTVASHYGSAYAKFIEKYDTGKEITLKYYEERSALLKDVSLGRVDAYLTDKVGGPLEIEKTGLPLQVAGPPVDSFENGIPFADNEKNREFLKRFDEALEQLRSEGVLTELSRKWLGTDVATPPAS